MIDLGPGAGALGGRLVFEGTPEELDRGGHGDGEEPQEERREIFLASESRPYRAERFERMP